MPRKRLHLGLIIFTEQCSSTVAAESLRSDLMHSTVRGEFNVAVSTACTRGIHSIAVETDTATWVACTLTTATRSAIASNAFPRTGSCTLAMSPDASAYQDYYSSVVVYGDLGVECGRHTPSFCAVNQKVQSNACVPCEPGASRP